MRSAPSSASSTETAGGDGAGLVERDDVDVGEVEQRIGGAEEEAASCRRAKARCRGEWLGQRERARARHHQHCDGAGEGDIGAAGEPPPRTGDDGDHERRAGEPGRDAVSGGGAHAAIGGLLELCRHPAQHRFAADGLYAHGECAIEEDRAATTRSPGPRPPVPPPR